MIIINAQLTSHDPLCLGVLFSFSAPTSGIKSLAVRDRFDIPLLNAEYELDGKYRRVPLAGIPRARFPLFVDAVESDGSATAFGPVYPAPTDTRHAAADTAVALPRVAIDSANDPEIRKLTALAHRGRSVDLGFERRRGALRSSYDALRPGMHMMLMASTVLSSTSAILLSTEATLYAVGGPAAGAIALALFAWRRLRRQREIERVITSLTKERMAELEEYNQAAERLIELGLPGLATFASGAKCGCATRDAPHQRDGHL